MIEINRLTKRYGSLTAIDDLNLTIETGTIVGLVGENGAGKTTLFRCMAGLEDFTGQILSDKNPLKNHLGFLSSEPYFLPKLTAKEYLQLMCNARNKKLEDIEDKNIFDLPLHRYAATFSTGMQKKLAITAILLQENSYFVLDEPFNGIDIQSNLILAEIIHRLRSLGKTIIISSHIFSTLSDTCDEIILLKQGRMVKTVKKMDFSKLESEMKKILIGNRIEKLNLL